MRLGQLWWCGEFGLSLFRCWAANQPYCASREPSGEAKPGRGHRDSSPTFPSFAMLPVLLSSGAGSLTGPPRAAAKAHRARLVPRAAAGQPQTAAPVHSNGAGKPDGAAREALSNGTPASSQAPAAEPAGAAQPAARRRYLINRIPRSRWENGIPAVMGAHLMGSGEVSPISTSKGATWGLGPWLCCGASFTWIGAGVSYTCVLIVQHSVAALVQAHVWRAFSLGTPFRARRARLVPKPLASQLVL